MRPKSFEVYTRQYTAETDIDDTASFDTQEAAVEYIERMRLGRVMRVWLNEVEIYADGRVRHPGRVAFNTGMSCQVREGDEYAI